LDGVQTTLEAAQDTRKRLMREILMSQGSED